MAWLGVMGVVLVRVVSRDAQGAVVVLCWFVHGARDWESSPEVWFLGMVEDVFLEAGSDVKGPLLFEFRYGNATWETPNPEG